MPFGIIGRTGPGMRQVVRFGNRFTGGVFLGATLGRSIVTNGDFTAYVCYNAATRLFSQITLDRLVIVIIILPILRCGKYAYFNVFYNGYERTEQLWPDVMLFC